jgi:hypothetical protein
MLQTRLPGTASEHDDQAALFRLIDHYAAQYPALLNVAAIPNGGHRHPATAAKLKREGVRRGVPDISCWVARHNYHGLLIELKRPGNYASAEQAAWLARLTAAGYLAVVCVGWAVAWRTLVRYLELPEYLLEGLD